MVFYFEKVVQNFKLKRIGGAPKGHLFIVCIPRHLLYIRSEFLNKDKIFLPVKVYNGRITSHLIKYVL